MNKLRWFLNDSDFSIWDRLRICFFFLNPKNRWTQGEYVKKYEKAWEKYTGAKYAVMVSSGSTANYLIAQHSKDLNPDDRTEVVLPSLTWQTSVSPWIREGFKPIFIDVSLEDFSLDLNKLEEYLKINAKKVRMVFITSLIGVTPDMSRAEEICKKYNVELKFDNCENAFGTHNKNHICDKFTSSTSAYFGHQVTTGGEGGIIFTNNEDEYVYYLMCRSHGMTRSILQYKDRLKKDHHKLLSNDKVDSMFDFAYLGHNFRSTDISAFMGLLNFGKIKNNIEKRVELYNIFESLLDKSKFILPKTNENSENVMFCLPIVFKNKSIHKIKLAKEYCEKNGIEKRQIIGGNLLRQTCFNKHGNYLDFPNAEHLHEYGFYVGLHSKVKERQIVELVEYLNNL